MNASLLRRATAIALCLLLALIAYLCFWPVPIDPVAWNAPKPPGYVGVYATNTRLADLRRTPLGSESGPEHIAIGPDGLLYAAMVSGRILRMAPDGSRREIFADTGGRVLGFDFDRQGRLIAADAMKGLLIVSPRRQVGMLTNQVRPGDPIRYANSVAVAADGTVYFTDSSTRFAPRQWGGTLEASVLDILEQSATGRVLTYDPATGRTSIVAHGLSFANGIAISADGRSLIVAETGRYRVWKIDSRVKDVDVQGGSSEAQVLLDNLPGYPDNVMRGKAGRIWIGLFRPRNPAADSLAQWPFLRKVLQRLPRAWLPLGKPYSHVFAIDGRGRVVEDLQDPSGAYPETTGATEADNRLYIHSLHAPAIGWLPR